MGVGLLAPPSGYKNEKLESDQTFALAKSGEAMENETIYKSIMY